LQGCLRITRSPLNYHHINKSYWNVYAPQILKTGARNIRYNLTFLVKKGRKLWKKHLWPILEPLVGVPDKKAADKQKRKDAADARKARGDGNKKTTKRKGSEFRDHDD
jgi:hypothetical protein